MTYYVCLYREAVIANKWDVKILDNQDPSDYFEESRDWMVVESFEDDQEVNAAFKEKTDGEGDSPE